MWQQTVRKINYSTIIKLFKKMTFYNLKIIYFLKVIIIDDEEIKIEIKSYCKKMK